MSRDKLPFVSVVVPVYNSEATINECLLCISKLNYPHEKLEVIVVDDGSTDKSIEIVKEYPSKLIQKRHGGYPSTMNAGLKASSGELLVIVDSDIYVTQDWLAYVVVEFNDPKVGIVSGYAALAPTKSFWAKLAGYEAEDRLDRLKTKYVDHVTSTCTAYRKKLFEDIGFFDERLKRGSDGDIAHRAFKSGWKIVFIKDAASFHVWKSSFKSYFKQQFREGRYAPLLIRKSPEFLLGKEIIPSSLYVPLICICLLLLTPFFFLLNYVWLSFLLFAILVVYHIPSAIKILAKHQDWVMLLFPVAVNVRYVAWLVGLATGIVDGVLGR